MSDRVAAVRREGVTSPDTRLRMWGRRLRRGTLKALPPLAIVAVVAVIWQLWEPLTGQPDFIVPPLSDVLSTTIDNTDLLMRQAWVTLREVVIGFVLAISVAWMFGVVIHHSRNARTALYPLLIASHAVPVLAIAPLIVVWFGFDIKSKVIIVALVSFFPMTINTIAGMAQLETDAVQLMRSFGATSWQVFWRARFPASLPYTFTGLKIGASVAVIGALVGEWVGSLRGLGPLMLNANQTFNTSLLFSAVIYLAAMGIGMFLLVVVVERLVIPWNFMTRRDPGAGA